MRTLLLNDEIYISHRKFLNIEQDKKATVEDFYYSSDEEQKAFEVKIPGSSEEIKSPIKAMGFPGLTAEFSNMNIGKTVIFGKTGLYKPKSSTSEKIVLYHPLKRKANPNNMIVYYNQILAHIPEKSKMPPILCSQCKSILSTADKPIKGLSWMCHYCGFKNKEEKSIPNYQIKNNTEAVEYELCGPDIDKKSYEENCVIIIDTSGSMADKDTGPKTALQILGEAMMKEIDKIKTRNPEAKIGFIFVNRDVEICGDCSKPSIVIHDNSVLSDEKKVREIAKKCDKDLFESPIKSSIENLSARLSNLKANGTTALGPAIACGLEILKEKEKASLLIVTDGLSNVGIGNLEITEDLKIVKERQYYFNWAREARESGIEVNFYSIAGVVLDPSLYSKIAVDSEGTIYTVGPDAIATEIDIPERKKDIAKDAEITIYVPKMLRIWLPLDPLTVNKDNPTIFKKKYGRITDFTREALRFVPNPKNATLEEVKNTTKVHFQVQIIYRDKNTHIKKLLTYTKEFAVINKRSKKIDSNVFEDLKKPYGHNAVILGKQDEEIANLFNLVQQEVSKPNREADFEFIERLRDTSGNVGKTIDFVTVKKNFPESSSQSKFATQILKK